MLTEEKRQERNTIKFAILKHKQSESMKIYIWNYHLQIQNKESSYPRQKHLKFSQ